MPPVFDEQYDREKDAINLAKHGIDFIAARRLWLDLNRVELSATDVDGEPRFLSIGLIDGRLWTAVYTYRVGHGIRFISVHRADARQERAYRG
jgi:uncharacterized DUF497 family protein